MPSGEIGPHAEDLPDTDPRNGLESDFVYAINSRAYTAHGREMGNPDFGIDLLRSEGLQARARTSLNQIPNYELARLGLRRVPPELIVDALFRFIQET